VNSQKIVIKTPTTSELLAQITPFVIDSQLENTYAQLLFVRKQLAKKIVEIVTGKPAPWWEDLRSLVKESPEHALGALTSMLGLSQEEFYRHITLVRLQGNRGQLAAQGEAKFASEWKLNRIAKEIGADPEFAENLFNLLLFGHQDPNLTQRVPAFLFAKLDHRKLSISEESVIDTLIRNGLKGSYDAHKGKPVVNAVEEILQGLVLFVSGEITVPGVDRKMDVVIPSIQDPHILIEVGVFATTARELSEKGLVETQVRLSVSNTYPDAVLVRVVDGVGWIARGGNALANVIAASHYILTQKTLDQLPKIVRAHVPGQYLQSGPPQSSFL
jgi:hypothetical protein